MDNYEKQVYIGRELFLQHDQDKLIEKYGLKHNEEYLYLKYIGTEYLDQPQRWLPLHILKVRNGWTAKNIRLL